MAAYTVQTTSLAGVVHTLAAVASSDTFANDGRTVLIVNNASGGSRVVTITPVAKYRGETLAARTITLATATTRIIGPFPPDIYNSATGSVTVTYDATTTTTAAAVQLGNI